MKILVLSDLPMEFKVPQPANTCEPYGNVRGQYAAPILAIEISPLITTGAAT